MSIEAGQTILASDCTHIRKISATAAEDLTAGQPVGISMGIDDYVSRAKRMSGSAAHGITSPLLATTTNRMACPIGGDKYVYLNYTAAGSDTLFAQVGSISRATMTLTLGTAASVATAFTPEGTALRNCCLCKLDTDKFIVFYLLDASATVIKYRVGTVSGTTITFGTEATFFTAATTVATSLAWGADQIATDKGVMFFKAATATDSRMVAFTTSGTVATAGAGVVPGTNSDDNAAGSYIKKIGTDKYVLVTALVAGNSLYAQVCTLSGTVITAGSEVQISTATLVGTASAMQVVSPATDVFVVRLQGTNSTTPAVIACTVSGTVPTAGTLVNSTATATNFGARGGIYALDASTLIVSASTGDKMAKFTLSGTTITYVGLYADQYATTNTNMPGILAMDNGYWVTTDWTDSTNVSVVIQGMSNNFVGFATGTVSRNGTATVILRSPIFEGQSSLIAGLKYLVSSGTLTAVANNVAVDTADDVDLAIAVNSTSVVMI